MNSLIPKTIYKLLISSFLVHLLFIVGLTAQTVSFISPANNSNFDSGKTVTISAAASGGTFQHLSIRVDGNYFAADKTAPYNFSVPNLSDGAHELFVYGKLSNGTFVNGPKITVNINKQAPTPIPTIGNSSVSITSPANNANFDSGSTINVAASGSGATFQHLSLQVDGNYFAADKTAPYNFVIPNLSDGPHTLLAYGKLADGTFVNGSAITILIKSKTPTPPPSTGGATVSLTSPANNASFNSGSTINVTASASGGTYQHVSLRVDGKYFASDKTAPYSFSVPNLSIGTHTILAYGKLASGEFINGPARTITIKSSGSTGGGTPPPSVGSGAEARYAPDIFSDSFSNSNWQSNYKVGNNNYVSYLKSGGHNGTGGLRIRVKSGEHYGAWIKRTVNNRKSVYAQYKVYYEDSFTDYVGKSPGFDGTRDPGGFGGVRSTGYNGWSARGSIDNISGSQVRNKYYVYHVNQEKGWGDSHYWTPNQANTSGPGDFKTKRWYTVDMYIKVNTPGKRNGILRAWVDGKKVFERKDYMFTKTTNKDYDKIDNFWVNYYYGGKDKSPSNSYVRIDDLRLGTKLITLDNVAPIGGGGGTTPPPSVTTASSSSNGISITYPKTAGSSFTVTAKTSSSFDELAVKVDGVWKAKDTSSPYSFNLTGLSNGPHTIFVYGKKSGKFTNGPTVSMTVDTTSKTEFDAESDSSIKVFPNPTDNQVELALGSNHNVTDISLTDITGRTIMQKTVRSDQSTIRLNMNEYSSAKGIYLLKFIKTDAIKVIKLIKN